jgi:DNA-directed RNA polymerase specialized sigma24 family protein
MRAIWQSLHANLMQSIETHNFRKQFETVRQTWPELWRFSDPYAVLDYLHSRSGDLDEKDRMLAVLVSEAQGDAAGRDIATTMLWLALWPGLDALHGRLWRRFTNSPEDLVSEICGRFTTSIHRANLGRIRRVAATLVLNVERDIRDNLKRKESEAKLRDDFPDQDGLDARMYAATQGLAPEFSHFGLPPGIGADEAIVMIHGFLAGVVGEDADLITAVVILGEGQHEAATRLGISHDAARKRFQRAIRRLHQEM